jgi:magnesium transporter
MLHARTRTSDGSIRIDPPAEDLHRLLEDPSNLTWIDLESPSVDELGLVAGLLAWSHLTVEDLTRQGQRAKLEQFEHYACLVMHALTYEGEPATLGTIEVDFVIGQNYLATVHYAPLAHMTASREVTEHTEALLGNGTDYVLYVLADQLVDSYFPVLDQMLEAVEDLEDDILANGDRTLMPRIFAMKRDAVVLRRTISPQLEVFSRLVTPAYGIVSETHVFYFRDVHDHLIRVFESTDSYRELMSGALDAYLSTVSNRMNEVMKRLAVVATVFLPISFITGLFGMNLRDTPPWDDNLFWVFLAAMGALSVGQWVYFVRRGWV